MHTMQDASTSRRLALAIPAALMLAVAIVALVGSPAQAQTITQRLSNQSFEQPGTNGAIPTNWRPVLFDGETAPFRFEFITFNASGQFPPPQPIPDGQFAVEVFYQVGNFQGVGGAGGQQTSATFGQVSNAQNPELVYDSVQTFFATPQRARWAGGIAEVEFTAGGVTNRLRYYHKYSATYSSAPVDGLTTRYIIEQPYAGNGQYLPEQRQNLVTDIQSEFGISDFTVTAIRFGNLLDQFGSGQPFPNNTTYWDDVRLFTTAVQATPTPTPGPPETTTPPAVIPEAPVAAALPVVALSVLGAGVVLSRRLGQRAGSAS